MSELISILNSASVVGLATLLAVIIWMLVKQQRATATIADNHLSGLPGMQATMTQIAGSLAELVEGQRRIEWRQEEAASKLTYLTARLNGGGKSPG